MRNLIYAINVTLDGCCDHAKGMADDELLDHYTQFIGTADLFVYGRKTYDLMVPYWPDVARDDSASRAHKDFARAFDATNKLVFSRTLERAGANTRIVRTGLREEILRLKQEPGKNMIVGGVDLPSQLVELGLVDEFHVVIQPIIAGSGRRLFDSMSLPDRLRLKLVESKNLRSGCVALRCTKSAPDAA